VRIVKRSLTAAGRSQALILAGAMLVGACGKAPKPAPGAADGSAARLSILLVTLDTTRADAIGPEAAGSRHRPLALAAGAAVSARRTRDRPRDASSHA
jgi:hypothetical protein